MKRFILFFSFCFVMTELNAQSQGLNYQAVLIDESEMGKQIPGVDVKGNFIPNKAIALRFTIMDASGTVDYQEQHITSTDIYGMINVVIGSGEPSQGSGLFSDIDWDGTAKDLKVELSLAEDGSQFEEFSLQPLHFVPYAAHRNITATGTLEVEGITDLNNDLNVNSGSITTLSGQLNVGGETALNNNLSVSNGSSTLLSGILTVAGATDLNSTLNVDGATDLNNTFRVNNGSATTLSGQLTVVGSSNLSSSLSVNGVTDLNNALHVNNGSATDLSGVLTVGGITNLNNSLYVGGLTALNGQVTINANTGNTESSYNSYPLRVEGNTQGIAVRLTAGTPDNSNNFITFFNNSGGAVGRIEGETSGEVASDPEFIFQEAILIAEEVKAGVAIGLAAIPVVVAGVGASAGPCGACIAMAAADLVLATANLVAFNVFAFENLGVTYQSGSADYAEWLERANPIEKISAGDIVGVTNGKISKRTLDAQQYLVISTKPAILGNMPNSGQEALYEKVAFMGQVPVKVRGIVLAGDFILPSGLFDGTGIAVSPSSITANQYREIVGVAWSSALIDKGISIINMAIGLNTNSITNLVIQQDEKISELQNKFNNLEQRLLALESGSKGNTKDATPGVAKLEKKMSRYEMLAAYMPEELNDETMEEAMRYLQERYRTQGIKVEDHPGLNKLFNDAPYRAEIIKKSQERYKVSYQNLLKDAKNKN